jgi:hypothetical protein
MWREAALQENFKREHTRIAFRPQSGKKLLRHQEHRDD